MRGASPEPTPTVWLPLYAAIGDRDFAPRGGRVLLRDEADLIARGDLYPDRCSSSAFMPDGSPIHPRPLMRRELIRSAPQPDQFWSSGYSNSRPAHG